jgi:hypothetical protein
MKDERGGILWLAEATATSSPLVSTRNSRLSFSADDAAAQSSKA